MALKYLPGIGPLISAVSTATSAAKNTLGEKQYTKTRRDVTFAYAAWHSFLPGRAMLVYQIPLFIVFLIILINITDLGGKVIIAAWLAMGITLTLLYQKIIDRRLSYGFDV